MGETVTRGLVPLDETDQEGPRLRDLIIRCKEEPGREFRVGVWEKKSSAERAANRHRAIFRETEPDILICSRRLRDVDGWGVIVQYLPPEMVRSEA
ncbi:MAG TPA: hypothetical protein VMY37_17250 [Thermoguttaceae bacterium]|nr:hypothetical protein [Thermoguttaceae bacterium]